MRFGFDQDISVQCPISLYTSTTMVYGNGRECKETSLDLLTIGVAVGRVVQ